MLGAERTSDPHSENTRSHHAYAVQRGLNLVNQLFLFLQERYPEYLIEHFGLPAE